MLKCFDKYSLKLQVVSVNSTLIFYCNRKLSIENPDMWKDPEGISVLVTYKIKFT